MCSFGYVLTDSNFAILKKEDILINPEAPFRLSRYNGEPQITLGYPKEKFYGAPNFVARYERIKKILEAKNQCVVGHSVLNDVNFLQIACDRYSKPHFEYSFVDEQFIYKAMNEGKAVSTALEKIAEAYGVEIMNLHRSDDDSEMTMEIVERICKQEGKTLLELAEEYPLAKGKVENGIVKRFVTDPYKWFCSAVFDLNPKVDEQKQGERKSGAQKQADKKPGETQREKQVEPQKNKFFDGKKFCFSTKLERTIPLKMYTLIEMITGLGGEYTDNPAVCDVFVKHKTSKCFRTQYAMQRKNIKIIPFESLLGLLEIKYDAVKPYDFKGDYVGKKPKTEETGVEHIEKAPSAIGDIIKNKTKAQGKKEQNQNDKKRGQRKKNRNQNWKKYVAKQKQNQEGNNNGGEKNQNDAKGN